MFDQVAAAFARQDYETAARLVKQLQQQSPDSPWVQLYAGRLQEVKGQLASADQIYRALLRETPHPKIALQARQGLHRLETQAQQRQSSAPVQPQSPIAAPSNSANSPTQSGSQSGSGTGAMILEAVSAEVRQTIAQKFGQIMRLDPYSARLLLPSRGWRLYRLGAIEELDRLGQQLVAAEIPAFWLPLTAVQRLRVFRVESLQFTPSEATVICQSETNQRGSLRFRWSEVAGRVEGRLPIFEQVVATDMRNQLTRKEQTQDYAQVIDLHLPRRNSILRFGDWSYQFSQERSQEQGAALSNQQRSFSTTSNRLKWNQLMRSIEGHLTDGAGKQVPVWSDFSAFAESALEPLAIVRDLPSHIDLFRKAPTLWDNAFQLYSGLVFEQKSRRSV